MTHTQRPRPQPAAPAPLSRTPLPPPSQGSFAVIAGCKPGAFFPLAWTMLINLASIKVRAAVSARGGGACPGMHPLFGLREAPQEVWLYTGRLVNTV